ncbi:MAG TPA: exodeoxyribonuclease VII large subunit, partial [Candidatus Polarisedimenticolia bacterium]|nr:exodeoxyribonuclease VII large subunit [Candidatus Polarisedimenticolia bacterium]
MTEQLWPLDGPPEDDDDLAGTRSKPLSISEVNATVRDILEDSFSDVWLQGEISNFKAHSSGHLYFSLKDSKCQINAVMFRGVALHLKFRPNDGLSVLARGRITLYEPRGSYQVNLQWMEPLGQGSLQLAFEELKARLKTEGLFDQDRKKAIPGLPRTVGVVTSPTGAAIRDILRVLERRYAGLRVIIAPCRVQGEGAAAEIAGAIRALDELSSRPADEGGVPIDVVILGRGGGSLEDLWAFNEEIVARAIARSDLPIISAVGHETDFTIADFVADLRAPTPSAAAEMVVKSREELVARVEAARARLAHASRYVVMRRRGLLSDLARSRAFTRVETAVGAA